MHYSIIFLKLILKIALLKLYLLEIMTFVDECKKKVSQLPKVPNVSIMHLLLRHSSYLQASFIVSAK